MRAWIITIIAAIIAVSTARPPAKFTFKTSEPLLLPPNQIERFTFGHPDMVADLLWIRAIQSFDYCGRNYVVEESPDPALSPVCEKGWIYQMLDAATRVSPRYRVVYSRGAIGLSVVVNDRVGASLIFDRGVSVFPKDWVISYQAGFHELYEMKNEAKSADLLKQAGLNGAPSWVPLLAARLYSDAGKAEFGLRAMRSFFRDKPMDEWPLRAQQRWSELESKLGRKVKPEEFPLDES